MQPGHPVVGEVHDESLSFEASLHGGGQPPLVLHYKHPHGYQYCLLVYMLMLHARMLEGG